MELYQWCHNSSAADSRSEVQQNAPSSTLPGRDAEENMASLLLETPQQDLAVKHCTMKTNPPSDSELPPRVGGGRCRDDLQQLKATDRTLLKELLDSITAAAFGSLHGSSAAKREAP
jgi:hypothetical protein